MSNILELQKQIKSYTRDNQITIAIQKYNKLIQLKQDDMSVSLQELGGLYENQCMYAEAIQCFVKIVDSNKSNIQLIGPLLNRIGICYFNMKWYKLAIQYFYKLIQLKELHEVYTNIGKCYVQLQNYSDAIDVYLKSYQLCNDPSICYSLGSIYYYMKEYNKSIYWFNKSGKDISEMLDLSFTYLAKKMFRKGFELYDIRLLKNEVNPQTNLKNRVEIPLPYWNGTDKCKRMLVVAEQGIGDNIQFYRFIIELSSRYPDMKICYFCRVEFSHIFKTYNNITIINNVEVVDFDYQLFIMSIPKILNIDDIKPNKINYINTNNEKFNYWKKTTSKFNKLKVGFVYNGLLTSYIEKQIPLKEFEILTDLNIDLICIHKKDEIECDMRNIHFKDHIHHFDIDNDTPFEDTICLLQNIDLLITVDTYITHLAGVLDIKTWLLLGVSDWRWSNEKHSTYWYNSVELIRTKKKEPFKDLLKTVKDKLEDYMINKG